MDSDGLNVCSPKLNSFASPVFNRTGADTLIEIGCVDLDFVIGIEVMKAHVVAIA